MGKIIGVGVYPELLKKDQDFIIKKIKQFFYERKK